MTVARLAYLPVALDELDELLALLDLSETRPLRALQLRASELKRALDAQTAAAQAAGEDAALGPPTGPADTA